MTVASDTSVASIFRPTSGPRTEANADKKEGAGSFGMMLDHTTQAQSRADAPAPRDDRAPARPHRRDDAAQRTDATSRAQDSRSARKANDSADSKRTADAKDASEARTEAKSDAKSDAKSEVTSDKADAKTAAKSEARSDAKSDAKADAANAPQPGESSEQPKAQDAQAAQATGQTAQAPQTTPVIPAVEVAVDATVTKEGEAVATEATGEMVVAAETPVEDTASTTDTTKDSEKTDDDAVAVAVTTVAVDAAPLPVVIVAIAAGPTTPVATDAPIEGDAEAIEGIKAANTQGASPAAPAAEAPKQAAAAPVVAQPAATPEAESETEAKSEGTAEATSEAKPATTSEAKSAAKSDAKPETKLEAKADVTTEATVEVTVEGKPEAKTEDKSEAKVEAKVEAKPETKTEAKPEAKADAKIEGAEPKLATTEAKPASDDKPEPAIQFSADDSAPKPEVKDAQHTKHSAEVNREIAADVSTKAADATLATAKAAIESVQNLNAAASPQPAAPALNITATAATAGAATANNMTPNAVPLDGVAVEIATQSQNGKSSFEIRLDPRELGRIDVRLEMDKDGNVTTKMTVERPETLDLLKRDAANIERALQQAGLKTSDNAMEFSLRDQNFSNNNRNDDNGSHAKTAQLVIPDDDGMPLEAVRNNYGRLLGLGRGLDIRI